MIPTKLVFVLCFFVVYCAADVKYAPDWNSLDARPLPRWYDDAKFGIFIHWGVFSVPSFGSEWFWNFWKANSSDYVNFMNQRYKPGFTYQEFAKDFTAEFYDASQWTEIFKGSGAKYVVLTTKHHEGYTLWPSKYSFGWNAMDVGPHRDLVGELSRAIRKTDLKLGLYHSLLEWYNPLWLNDKKNAFSTNTFVTNKIIPELKELVETYKPDIVWSDGSIQASDAYWKSKDFIAWLYNESPVKETVVTNDRWGVETPCKHGDFYTCSDHYNPGVLQKHKWENCMTIDRKSWGYRRNARLEDYLSLEELVKELVSTVSCGGNLLMNVGPTKDGIIPPIFQERLKGIGKWLSVNGEAIYNSKPWKIQNDTMTGDVWYTVGENNHLYAIMLSWPEDDILTLGAVKPVNNSIMIISMLGSSSVISWKQTTDHLYVKLPQSAHRDQPAWTLRIAYFDNSSK